MLPKRALSVAVERKGHQSQKQARPSSSHAEALRFSRFARRRYCVQNTSSQVCASASIIVCKAIAVDFDANGM
jgi:hypothetical protein